jgi:precorrin-8X/cobalt-precorrin-8 methylmutase
MPQSRYLRDPAAIYRESFAAIRREAGIDELPADLRPVAVRLIHACGMPDIVADLAWTADAVRAGRAALRAGAPILVDATMVAAGIRRNGLPADNPILCTLQDDATAARAHVMATTRSAAAVDGWRERLDGAVVAIGNAPTALFRLLELLADGAPRPALVLGFPVGFIGAAEAKQALIACRPTLPHIALRGRRGGSAMAAAALNALLAEDPLRDLL